MVHPITTRSLWRSLVFAALLSLGLFMAIEGWSTLTAEAGGGAAYKSFGNFPEYAYIGQKYEGYFTLLNVSDEPLEFSLELMIEVPNYPSQGVRWSQVWDDDQKIVSAEDSNGACRDQRSTCLKGTLDPGRSVFIWIERLGEPQLGVQQVASAMVSTKAQSEPKWDYEVIVQNVPVLPRVNGVLVPVYR